MQANVFLPTTFSLTSYLCDRAERSSNALLSRAAFVAFGSLCALGDTIYQATACGLKTPVVLAKGTVHLTVFKLPVIGKKLEELSPSLPKGFELSAALIHVYKVCGFALSIIFTPIAGCISPSFTVWAHRKLKLINIEKLPSKPSISSIDQKKVDEDKSNTSPPNAEQRMHLTEEKERAFSDLRTKGPAASSSAPQANNEPHFISFKPSDLGSSAAQNPLTQSEERAPSPEITRGNYDLSLQPSVDPKLLRQPMARTESSGVTLGKHEFSLEPSVDPKPLTQPIAKTESAGVTLGKYDTSLKPRSESQHEASSAATAAVSASQNDLSNPTLPSNFIEDTNNLWKRLKDMADKPTSSHSQENFKRFNDNLELLFSCAKDLDDEEQSIINAYSIAAKNYNRLNSEEKNQLLDQIAEFYSFLKEHFSTDNSKDDEKPLSQPGASAATTSSPAPSLSFLDTVEALNNAVKRLKDTIGDEHTSGRTNKIIEIFKGKIASLKDAAKLNDKERAIVNEYAKAAKDYVNLTPAEKTKLLDSIANFCEAINKKYLLADN